MNDPGPRRLGEALDVLLGTFNAPSSDVLFTVFGCWDQIVGPAAARHCKPISLDSGRLVVAASDPMWASEIGWLSSTIVNRINDTCGSNRVESMVVRVVPDFS